MRSMMSMFSPKIETVPPHPPATLVIDSAEAGVHKVRNTLVMADMTPAFGDTPPRKSVTFAITTDTNDTFWFEWPDFRSVLLVCEDLVDQIETVSARYR